MGLEYPLEEQMATYFSILAWEIPWTEEPGGRQSMGHKESVTAEYTHTHTHTKNHTFFTGEGINGNPLKCKHILAIIFRNKVECSQRELE